jgi:rubrerythrin
MDNKKVRKIISALKKASKTHAAQAKQLEGMLKQKKK